MKFFERLFGKTQKEEPKKVGAPTKAEKRAVTRDYAGPLIGVFKTVEFYSHQSLLLELKNSGDVKTIPQALLAVDQFASFLRENGVMAFRSSEDAYQITETISLQHAISGGRSGRRPTWFSDLNDCGACIFVVENYKGYYSNIEWQVANMSAINAPIVFLINQKTKPENPPPTSETDPILFTQPPTLEEFCEKMGFKAEVFATHPVRIVLCPNEVQRRKIEETTDSANAKSKAKANETATPKYSIIYPESTEITDALVWLSGEIIADSYVSAKNQRLVAEEEKKLRLAEEEEEKRKKKEEAAQLEAKSAVSVTTNTSSESKTKTNVSALAA